MNLTKTIVDLEDISEDNYLSPKGLVKRSQDIKIYLSADLVKEFSIVNFIQVELPIQEDTTGTSEEDALSYFLHKYFELDSPIPVSGFNEDIENGNVEVFYANHRVRYKVNIAQKDGFFKIRMSMKSFSVSEKILSKSVMKV